MLFTIFALSIAAAFLEDIAAVLKDILDDIGADD